MLTKIIQPDPSWVGHGEPILSMAAYGTQMVKQASEISELSKFAEPQAGRTQLLCLALGSGEYWGCNRNGDYFTKEANEKYHPTFVKFGFVHKNHKNKPWDDKFGVIKQSFYNPRMERVELLLDIPNDLNKEIIEKVAEGLDVPVSMAAKLPWDKCSSCGNIRKTAAAKDTCECIRTKLTKIASDGSQVYAVNEHPRFFDISFVYKPADRTAYVMKKVASAEDKEIVKSATDLATEYGLDNSPIEINTSRPLSKSAMEMFEFIHKLAELEKKVEGVIRGEDNKHVKDVLEDVLPAASNKSELTKKSMQLFQHAPKRMLFASLADRGVILSPQEFVKVAAGPAADGLMEKVMPLIKGIFSRLAELKPQTFQDNYPEQDLEIDKVQPHGKMSKGLEDIDDRSALPKPVIRRSITIVMIGKKPKSPDVENKSDKSLELPEGDKEITKKSSESLPSVIAALYGMYKAASLKYILDKENSEELQSSIPAIYSIIENYL